MPDLFDLFGFNDFTPDRFGIGEPLFRTLPSEYGDQTVGSDDGNGDGEGNDGQGQGSSDAHGDQDSGNGSGTGDGEEQDDAQEGSGGGGASDDQDGQDGQGSGDGSDQGSANDPGSGSRGSKNLDAARRGLSPDNLEQLQRSMAEDIARSGKSAGNAIPDAAVEWAAEFLLPPKLPLHELFQNTLGALIDTSRSGHKATYRRRSRRQDAVGDRVILPGKARAVTEVMVGIDVSGSRSDDELERDFAEIAAVAESKGFRVRYFSVSTVHHEIRDLHTSDLPVFDRDYAGTDMRMAFEVFDAHDAPARILMTDGYTGWPDSVRSGTETLVTITSDSEEEYERVRRGVPAGVDTVWLPPEGIEGRPIDRS